MVDVRGRVRELERHSKDELKELLATELGSSYTRGITDSLRNDFMRACYDTIEPGEPPDERLKEHPEYEQSWQSWGTKRSLATALRMVLTEYVDRPQSEGLTSLDKQALAELIVAIRVTNDRTQVPFEDEDGSGTADIEDVPERATPPDRSFDDVLPADRFDSYELYSWIATRRSETDGEHGVYVLDCTPSVRGEERARLESLRGQAAQKVEGAQSLSKRERAAQAITNGERVYYVGYASDVPVRVRQHVGGRAAGGAEFTNMFKPVALVDVSWYDTEAAGRQHERRRADELTIPGESYAYWE